jgi:hypothetical protein
MGAYDRKGPRVFWLVTSLSEEGPAEVSGLATAGHQLVERVDVVHVVHDTEGEVGGNTSVVLGKVLDVLEEAEDLALVALVVLAAEVLAGSFSDPDRLVEGRVVVVDVIDQALRRGTVEVDSNTVECATRASIHEIFHPLLSIRTVRASRGDELVATRLERLDVFLPDVRSVPRRHVGLAGFIGFIHSQNVISIVVRSIDNVLNESVNVLIAPQHRSALEAKGLCTLGAPGTPSVDEFGSVSLVEVKIAVVLGAVGPSDTHFALASTGRRSSTRTRVPWFGIRASRVSRFGIIRISRVPWFGITRVSGVPWFGVTSVSRLRIASVSRVRARVLGRRRLGWGGRALGCSLSDRTGAGH